VSASPPHAFASYFRNHRLGRRFPWSLYHQPIDASLRAFLGALSAEARVLNVGCGMFLNLPDLPRQLRYVGTDLDPRAVEACRAHYAAHPIPGAPALELAQAGEESLPFADASFDAAYATEVIEHCARPEVWLREVMRVVRPGGRVLLTTPNYASVSLNVIESTALEVVARAQGFTRRGIHPIPFTAPALAALVRAVGGKEPNARTTSFGWVVIVEFGV
jgi:SAM-dependent methyltransferase